MQSNDRLDRIEAILAGLAQRNVEADQRMARFEQGLAETRALVEQNAQNFQRHEIALDRIDATLSRAAELIESNARSILATDLKVEELVEAERESAMLTEEIFERRLDGFQEELRASRESTNEELSAMRRSLQSIEESVISLTTFVRQEFRHIWEQLRAG